jgi:hypothetical protein
VREHHIFSSSNLKSIFAYLGMSVLTTGTLAYAFNEGWSSVDALHWPFITSTTAGYGGLRLTQPSSRLFSIVYFLSSHALLLASATQAVGEARE